jgi:hypothetical protein
VLDRAKGAAAPFAPPPSARREAAATGSLRIIPPEESDHLADPQSASVASLRQLAGIPVEH